MRWGWVLTLIVVGLCGYGVQGVKAQDQIQQPTSLMWQTEGITPIGATEIDGKIYDDFVFADDAYDTILDLEQTLNICWEEFTDHISPAYNEDYSVYIWHVSVPKNAPLCYNDQHQRLTYYSDDRQPLATPEYSTRKWAKFTEKDLADIPYCRGDLIRVNPALASHYYSYRSGMTLFIDENIRLCETVDMPLKTSWFWIDGVSFEKNICFDDLIEANLPGFASFGIQSRRFDITADVPYDHLPCYDQYGHRLGYEDKSVYQARPGETFKDVANRYNVCIQDLLDYNPHASITSIRSVSYHNITPIIFIPRSMPCDTGEFYRTSGDETLTDISRLYDVCLNHIQKVNPTIAALSPEDLLPAKLILEIPHTLPCWRTSTWVTTGWYAFSYVPIPYACYIQAIDFNKDYTSTKPPLSLELDTNAEYCYEIGKKPILYENKFLDLIGISFYESQYEVALCYGLDFEAFIELNEIPYLKRVRSETTVFVPHDSTNTHCDWRALNATLGHFDEATGIYTVKRDDTVASIGRQFGYEPAMIAAENDLEFPYTIYPYQKLRMPERFIDHRGQIDNKGVYIVAYSDTLSSIGHEFGYLPSMIAAENDLESPYVIYSYQELQMPRMPSLYDIGKAVLYVGGVGVGLVAFGVYRMRQRTNTKKKQKPAA